jgi:hypothetical protein
MIRDEVSKAARKKRLLCASALALADKLKVKPVAIGQAANELGIKISGCQLGCFDEENTKRIT